MQCLSVIVMKVVDVLECGKSDRVQGIDWIVNRVTTNTHCEMHFSSSSSIGRTSSNVCAEIISPFPVEEKYRSREDGMLLSELSKIIIWKNSRS